MGLRPWSDYLIEAVLPDGRVTVRGPLTFHGVVVSDATTRDVSLSELLCVSDISEAVLRKMAESRW